MALVTVAADKRHLVDSKGQPFFILGVNYHGYFDRAWKMWALFDPELVTLDFRKAQHSGFNTVRLFIEPVLALEIQQNNFAKLDQTLSIAQDHNLKVLLVLNEAHSLDLEQVGQLDAQIAGRYKDVPTVLGYELQNKPVFYDLAGAIYPGGYKAALQTSHLVDHYGARVSQAEALELQRSRRLPAQLEPEQAFYYMNALRLFTEYDVAIKRFINQGRGTIIDFLLSTEAVPWHPLIEVLDSSLESWLQARITPIRAAGSRQLLSAGWNLLHFAALPANRALDFQQYQVLAAEPSLGGFNTLMAHLKGLQRAFPQHPLALGEFGWSNQSSSNPATSQPVPGELTALYEAACYAYLRANNLAGGFKWTLNDAAIAHNPYEASLGVFQSGDQPKPIRELTLRFSEAWPPVDQPATFTPAGDLETGLSYRLDWPQQSVVGGHIYQDRSLSWRAEGVAGHYFIKMSGLELEVETLGAGQLSLVPWELLPGWNRARETDLYRVFEHQRSRQQSFGVGEPVVVEAPAGARYIIAMGTEGSVGPSSEDLPEVEPQAGEHVLLLGDSEQYLPAALKYIRRFAPDVTFTPDQVNGRWAYVSVVATPQQVPEEVLEAMRSVGTVLVERIVDNSPEATQRLLDRLAAQGQRFLSAAVPPQAGPPLESGAPQPEAQAGNYIVQPGDTLSLIAQKVYDEAHLWSLIFEANRDKIATPHMLRVGTELLIPEREEI